MSGVHIRTALEKILRDPIISQLGSSLSRGSTAVMRSILKILYGGIFEILLSTSCNCGSTTVMRSTYSKTNIFFK